MSDAAKLAVESKEVQQAALAAVEARKAKTLVEALRGMGKPTRRARRTKVRKGGEGSRHVDALGQVVPEEFRDVFALRGRFVAAGELADELRRAVEGLVESQAGFYMKREHQSLDRNLEQLKDTIARTAPYTIATRKRDEPKWVSESAWSLLSDEERPTA